MLFKKCCWKRSESDFIFKRNTHFLLCAVLILMGLNGIRNLYLNSMEPSPIILSDTLIYTSLHTLGCEAAQHWGATEHIFIAAASKLD